MDAGSPQANVLSQLPEFQVRFFGVRTQSAVGCFRCVVEYLPVTGVQLFYGFLQDR